MRFKKVCVVTFSKSFKDELTLIPSSFAFLCSCNGDWKYEYFLTVRM